MNRRLATLVLAAVLGIGLAAAGRVYLAQVFLVPSASMEPTLHGCAGCHADRILVSKLTYRLRDIHRGDVVVFRGTGTGFAEAGTHTYFVKRVIGLPGDTVGCCDQAGRVTVNSQPLDEPYLSNDDHQPFGPVVVPAGELWLMGDNRGDSADSRDHGSVPERNVVGNVVARLPGDRGTGPLHHDPLHHDPLSPTTR